MRKITAGKGAYVGSWSYTKRTWTGHNHYLVNPRRLIDGVYERFPDFIKENNNRYLALLN